MTGSSLIVKKCENGLLVTVQLNFFSRTQLVNRFRPIL